MRADIQGLRALAVLLVIADHAWGLPGSGWIGVDVFFVISGFVITQALLKEGDRRGRLSIADFYRRRVRRIVPGALLVLTTTVGATYFLYGSGRGGTVLADSAWAALMVGNWRLAMQQTDYFAATSSISPVQHYWSLAVEEQFYLLWPLLLGLAMLFMHRRGTVSGRRLAAGVVVVSFAYSLWHTSDSPTWAYFSSLDRAWELGVGALLATSYPQVEKHLSDRLRGLGGWVGLGAILVAAFVVPDSQGFPAPWAALPVIGTALVLAGAWHGGRSNFLLTNPISGYVGTISYSLYLWHFPILVLGAAWLNPSTPVGAAVYVLLLAGTSMAAFHWVEDPIRHSMWLEPRSRSFNAVPMPELRRLGALALGAVTVVTSILVYTALAPHGASMSPTLANHVPRTTQLEPGVDPATLQADRIERALSATAMPNVRPDVSALANWDALIKKVVCVDAGIESLEACASGSDQARKTALLYGDSFAMAWAPGIQLALPKAQWKLYQYTLQSCPWWGASMVTAGGEDYPICDTFHESLDDVVRRVEPDLVILAAGYEAEYLASGAEGEEAVSEIRAAGSKVVSQLANNGTDVVILSPPPMAPKLAECMTRFAHPADCVGPLTSTAVAWQQLGDAIASAGGGRSINVSEWFCVGGRCPGIVEDLAVRSDGMHLTPEFSRTLWPVLRFSLLRAR